MTINIEELRKVIADCYWPTSPVAINKLLDRLEVAEKENALRERVIDALGSELNAAANERAALAAQAPRACTCHPDDRPDGPCRERYAASECQALATQAQPAPSVPGDILYRLGAAHDACLDGDHRECRDIITQLMCEIGPDGAVPEPEASRAP